MFPFLVADIHTREAAGIESNLVRMKDNTNILYKIVHFFLLKERILAPPQLKYYPEDS